MISHWKESRAARKFFRSRLSVAALAVIFGYLVIAAIVFFGGLVSLEKTGDRVGANNVPGFFREQQPEKRLDDCEAQLETVDRALGTAKPQQAIDEIQFGKLRVADRSLEELRETVDEGWRIYDELALSPNINESAELWPQLEQLERVTTELFPPPTGWDGFVRGCEMILGTDRQGRSIALRAIYSIKVAIQIGVVTALLGVMIGALLGTAAGYFGGWVDHAVIWLYTTFSSIPNLVLLVLLAYMFTGTRWDGTLVPVYVAFSLTFWVGPCRVLRGETLKLKEHEYVQAAKVMGCGRFYIMLWHILPNTLHLLLINFSLLFIGAIKSEVILSYLGLGVKTGPSWGIMISQSGSEVINSFFWQIATATAFMFGLVLAFNIVSDALQDAFDPKHQ